MSTTLKELIRLTNKPPKKTVSFKCDVETLHKLQQQSKNYGISLSSLINHICNEYYMNGKS